MTRDFSRRRLLQAGALGTAALAGACASVPASRDRDTDAFLDDVQQRTFRFFWETTNSTNGMARDRWPTPSFASMAAVGFALTAYPIGAERGWVPRRAAAARTLATLRFLSTAPQGDAPRGMTGHRGFFYHFVDMERGRRFERTELSTIDTALLLGGALFAAGYFDRPDEREIRDLVDLIYERVDWRWALARPPLISHGWSPEGGHIPYDWVAYSEATLLYVLALGAPANALGRESWDAWAAGLPKHWRENHVGFPPLFGHQYSHVWIDFRGIRDAFMRTRGLDYHENSRRATLHQLAYARANPLGWRGYGDRLWGLTACDGPADVTVTVDGRQRTFKSYAARGPGEFDDGTVSPTAVGGSVPFAPEHCIPALRAMRDDHGEHLYGRYGFLDSLNPSVPPTVPLKHGRHVPGRGWYDGDYLGIDQGPILAMIENHRTGLVWDVMRRSAPIRRGLERAGFTGGWLA